MEKWWENSSSFEAIQQLVYAKCLVGLDNPLALKPCSISVTLEPSLFPRRQYELVRELQPHFNSLVDSVSRDHEFLVQTFEKISRVDDFVKQLFHIYMTVTKMEYKEKATLGIHRMDNMLHYVNGQLSIKQVELNTMASAGGPVAEALKEVHDYVTSRYSSRPPNAILPDCPATSGLCKGMAVAWNTYGSKDAHVLFVVLKEDRNTYEQRLNEYHLWSKHQIKVTRKTLTEISTEGKLDKHRRLFIGDVEIAIVYYRAGYSPDHFPTEKEWEARLMCEMSCASNCPNLPYLLVGFKKVQQLLAAPGVLERYCQDTHIIEKMRNIFAGQYSLDMTREGDLSMKMAMEKAEQFVMKPQREGGGNNIYGEDIRTLLEKIGTSHERERYILMERIQHPSLPGVIWWKGKDHATAQPVVNELGIFGTYVRSGNEVLLNSSDGHTIRSKHPSTNEGGIGCGASALGTPLLIPDEDYIQQILFNKEQ